MKKWLFAAFAAFAFASAQAGLIMPDFASVPTGWSVDRYMPDYFANLGTQHGRTDVLGIGIGDAGNAANRGGQSSTFYNTQGMGHAITGGAGDTLSASLYVSGSWADAALGARRTDMWGVITDATSAVADYPIIGFTNKGDGGFVGFRTWDNMLGVWHDLTNVAVNYDGWNDLSILFTGTAYKYSVNGSLVDSFAADPSAKNFSSVLMQAYNFADPTLGTGYVANPYEADWTNTPASVPEPGSFALLGAGLIGLGAVRRKKIVR